MIFYSVCSFICFRIGLDSISILYFMLRLSRCVCVHFDANNCVLLQSASSVVLLLFLPFNCFNFLVFVFSNALFCNSPVFAFIISFLVPYKFKHCNFNHSSYNSHSFVVSFLSFSLQMANLRFWVQMCKIVLISVPIFEKVALFLQNNR